MKDFLDEIYVALIDLAAILAWLVANHPFMLAVMIILLLKFILS